MDLYELRGRAREDGFGIVHAATILVARERQQASYFQLVRLLEACSDVDVKTAALTLINQLVLSAGSGTASRTKLLAVLDKRLKLADVLSSQLHILEPPFVEQLAVNVEVMQRMIPRSWDEAKRLQ